MQPRRQIPAIVKIGVLVVLVIAVIAVPYTRRRVFEAHSISGFAAFYCAGQVLRHAGDPYRAEPLRGCERALPSYRYGAVGVVEPAPFPPVVLAAFAALSLLPFGTAFALFVALALAATVLAAWALVRLTGLPVTFVAASLAVAALYQNLKFGEIPPLVIGILCLAALLLERRRAAWAAVVAALSLVEPHVAAPVLVALLVASKPARIPLVVIGVVLIAFSALVHPALSVEYFTRVLSAHAASEVTANDQYSVTWIAHQLGAPDGRALLLGTLSYALMALAGIVVGARLAARFGRPAFVVLVPAAFALMGGTFIHDIQLPIALPAALLLVSVTTGRLRSVALAAVMLLAVSWFDDFSAALGICALALLAWTAPVGPTTASRRLAFAAAICGAYVLFIVGTHVLPAHAHVSLAANPDVTGAPDELASAVWARYVRATPYGWATVKTVAQKLPLFGALLLLAYTALRALSARAVRGVSAA